MATVKQNLERLREIDKEVSKIYDELENELLQNSENTSSYFKDLLSCSVFEPNLVTNITMTIGAAEFEVLPLLEKITEGKTLWESDYVENRIH